MKVKIALLAFAIISFPFFSGCWSYKGANEIDIVSGMTIDRSDDLQGYKMNVEIIDLDAAAEKSSVATKYVEIEAPSIIDGARNVKRMLVNKFFFGNMEMLIISEDILRTEGIWNVLEIFMRSPEPRETLIVAVAQGSSAAELVHSRGMDTSIVSYGISRIIKEDTKVTSSTKSMGTYEVYNTLKEEGDSLVLPAIHYVDNNGDMVVESNGLAVFKEDKLIGYLTPEESRYYLFIDDDVIGGAVSFVVQDPEVHRAGFEISKSKTKKSYTYENEKLKISIEVKITLNLKELAPEMDLLKPETERYLENTAKNVIDKGILNIIEKAKTEYAYDIFGFGNLIYKKDPKLWNEFKEDWQNIFQASEFEVNTIVSFGNTGIILNY